MGGGGGAHGTHVHVTALPCLFFAHFQHPCNGGWGVGAYTRVHFRTVRALYSRCTFTTTGSQHTQYLLQEWQQHEEEDDELLDEHQEVVEEKLAQPPLQSIQNSTTARELSYPWQTVQISTTKLGCFHRVYSACPANKLARHQGRKEGLLVDALPR